MRLLTLIALVVVLCGGVCMVAALCEHYLSRHNKVGRR